MSGEASTALYQKRFQWVIDYIYDHLDQPLDLNKLAEVACMSPYHWHRIYHATYGETLASTVKRLRLHKAAGKLANSDSAVAEIAKTSGYTSLQSFSRAFSETYGMPPAKYRKQGSHTQFHINDRCASGTTRSTSMHEVNIKQVEAFEVISFPHTGPYINIGHAFEKLFGWLAVKGLFNPEMKVLGVYYDDPSSVPENELRSAACVTLCGSNDIDLDENMALATIQGGEYAVLRFKGPYSDMHKAYAWLYGEWFPKSGREPGNQPAFEDYLNNPREVAPNDLLTDIYLALK
ncbi:AraC family transcriptional regulator [Litoribacillus peritrichatus]|uniref:AraC family transcriptional regulator n=1 Tax=Litoribacillus peritrichatus TaxID=718191 RepID=A0ABP7N6I5_9GAMM